MTTAAPWSTSSSVSTVWMPRSWRSRDDALVVDDLAEGVRHLAGGRRFLGLVDRLAHAVAEAGALRDADFFDDSHGPIIARGPRGPATATDLGGRLRRVLTPLGRRQQLRDPLHDQRRREALRRAALDVRGQHLVEAERAPDADRHVATRVRELLAARPDPVRAGDAERHDRRAGPQGERRDPVLGGLEPAVRAARALGEDEQHLALVEDPPRETERLEVGRAAVDRVDAAVGRHPADDRPRRTAPSCRASGCAGRASGSATRRCTIASRFEAWLAARMSGPSFGSSSIAPSIRTRLIARAKSPPVNVSVVSSGLIEPSMGASSVMRRRASVPLRRLAAPRRRGSHRRRRRPCPRTRCRRSR